ncbi:MAG: leucine-rich repeat domain-containing protein [Bacteroidales bacterium]|nr:leucine-rich repeat domain-containing protein [Bacteroidales bacterium]
MQTKDLQLKRALCSALLVLLVCLAGMTKALAQSFTVNNLNFSVNGDGASVTITGHSIVSNTTGNLYIPSTVSYTYYENGHYVTQTYTVTRIGDYAFEGSTGFTGTLTIPSPITYIGVGAFANTDFTTVNYYATNCEDIAIGYYYAWYFYYYTYQGAFRYCPNLTTIHIGSNVQRIPAYLFNECDGLMGNLTLPSSLIEVGKEAFSGCSGLTGDLTIPNSVTTIGESAFSFCTGFTGSLSIGNSVTTIDAGAFANCGFTGGLSIPNSVTTIGVSAFSNCTGFTGSLTIPNSVTSIGSSAFSGCTGFTGSLTIPNTITSIENSTFYGCSGLTGNLTIPNSVTSIGGSAFSGCTDFTGGLIIPNTITSIEEYTFYGCSGFMGNLSIPNSVTTIGKYAFDGCSGLTGELTIPSFVANIEVGAFANTGFTIVNFNATNCSDIEIGYSTVFAFNYYEYQGAFRYCPNLTTLHIGANVQRIPAYSFNDCEGLAGNLTLPSSLVEIGTEAFSGCSGFTGNLTIPNSVMTIGDDAFYGCSGFSGNLTIPNSVTMIGNWAFGNCSGFTGGLTISNSLAEIGIGVFYNCSGFTGGLTIPNSVTSIGSSAFYECSGFTGSLTIPNSVVELGDYAFNGCIGFTGSISILGGITSIGDGTFSGCNNLTGNLSIPTTVTEIGKYAFEGCSNLTGILTVPSSVTNIEVGAFANTGFTTVNFNATNCNDIEIGYSSMFSFNYYEYQGAFRYCPNLTTLHIGANVQRIPAYSFNDCEGLAGNLTLPSSLVEIGKSAFSWCTGFTGGITIPNSVTTIGEDAFSGCAGFTGSLTIGTSVVTIDSEAFYGCSGLTGNLTIPNSVVELGNYAFNGCTGFTGNLTIGSSVTSIGSWAFASCDNFDSIKVLVQIPPELENNAFNSLPTNIAVEVPCGTLNAYQNASGWSAFTNMQENCTTSFIITALANPSEGGTITGGGTYLQSTTCTLTATTNEDYVFVNWTENGIQISTNPTYVFSVTEDRTLVANFQLQSFVINASANPWAGGIVTGDGFYMQGSSCTLTATAHDEYVFFNWTENDSVVSADATYTFTVMGERNLFANFLTGNIVFADANVKAICVANWDTNNDGELSYVEAAAVTNLGKVFRLNQTITSFDELQYFTGLTSLESTASKNGDSRIVTPKGGIVTPQGEFYNCKNLTSIIIPNHVTIIGGNAFMFCQKLASIEIPNSVTLIGDYAFIYCYDLATIELPNSVTTIGESAFSNCSDLTSIEIPNSVTSIGKSAFYYCSNLTTVEIGNSVDTIGPSAFGRCSRLTSLTVYAETPPSLGGNVFYAVNKSIPVYVPCGMADAYQAANGWSEFTNFQEMECLSYEITAIANLTEGGTVNGDGTYQQGQICILTAIANEGYTFVNWTKNGTVVSTEASYSFTVTESATYVANFSLDAYHFITAGAWSTAANWLGGAMPGATDEVFIDAPCQLDQNATIGTLTVSDGQSLTLQSGKTLTVTDDMTNTVATGLVIEDGAQLVHNVANVQATVRKVISPFNGTSDSWHLIALPLMGSIDVDSVVNLLEGEYDLYSYDETTTYWKNKKTTESDFTELEATKGYLYANSAEVTLGFSGTLENSSAAVSVPLSYTNGANLSGFNLVGNPFPCNAYLDREYYTLSTDGTDINPEAIPATTPIPPGTAVFVKAEAEGETVVFTRVVQ